MLVRRSSLVMRRRKEAKKRSRYTHLPAEGCFCVWANLDLACYCLCVGMVRIMGVCAVGLCLSAEDESENLSAL